MSAQGFSQHAPPALAGDRAVTGRHVDRDMPSDVAVMHAAQRDLACFAPIYDRYAARVYLYCLRRVGSAQEAEDLTSLTFTRALGAVAEYRGGSVAAWLFCIARNAITDHYRARPAPNVALELVEDVLPDANPSPVEQVIDAERRHHLRELLASFTDEERELLALSISGGLTSKEIGQVLGQRPGAVRMRLHRLLKRLRALVGEEYL